MEKSIKIYRGKETIHEFIINSDFLHQYKLMGDDYISFTLSSKNDLDLQIGDGIEHDGRRYILYEGVEKTISGGVRSYSLKFYADYYKLKFVPFQHLHSYNFSYYGGVSDFIKLLFNSLELGGHNEFSPGIIEENGNLVIEFAQESCLSALNKICEKFQIEWEVSGTTINVKKQIGKDTSYTFEYGKGKGSYAVTRKKVSNQDLFTGMIGFGGTQNLPADYESAETPKRLNLHGTILQKNVSLYGLRLGFYQNDDIYPRLKDRSIISVEVPEDISAVASWKLEVDLPFNLTQQLIPDTPATLKFQSGDLAGESFEIAAGSWNNEQKTLDIITKEENGYYLPSENRMPKKGDEYVLLGITMPYDPYVVEAEKELYEKTEQELNKTAEPSFNYSVEVDPLYVSANQISLTPGDTIIVTDGDRNNTTRVLEIRYPLINPAKITLSLGDTLLYSYTEKISNTINDITNTIENVNKNVVNIDRRGWRDVQELSTLLQTTRAEMLLLGNPEGQFSISCILKTNKDNNPNLFAVSAGLLQHNVYKDGPQKGVWEIGDYEGRLSDSSAAYFVYAKCDKVTSNAVIITSSTRIAVEAVSGFYHFEIGVISSKFEGARVLNTTKGFTQIAGGNITTEKIQDSGRRLVIDLPNAKITAVDGAVIEGNLKILPGSSGLENLADWPDNYQLIEDALNNSENALLSIENLVIGGRNYVRYSGDYTDQMDIAGIREAWNNDQIVISTIPNTTISCISDQREGRVNFIQDGIKVQAGKQYILTFNVCTYDSDKKEYPPFHVVAFQRDEQIMSDISIYDHIAGDYYVHQLTITPKYTDNLKLFFYVTVNGYNQDLPPGSQDQVALWMGNIKLEAGTKPTGWTPAPEDIYADMTEYYNRLQSEINAYNYIKEAFQQGTTSIAGGLILSDLILLKGIDNIVRSGISGLKDDNVGFFTGGTYEDAQAGTAKNILYKDGSVRFASGKINSDPEGNTKIGIFNLIGGDFYSDYITLSNDKIESLSSLINSSSSIIIPSVKTTFYDTYVGNKAISVKTDTFALDADYTVDLYVAMTIKPHPEANYNGTKVLVLFNDVNMTTGQGTSFKVDEFQMPNVIGGAAIPIRKKYSFQATKGEHMMYSAVHLTGTSSYYPIDCTIAIEGVAQLDKIEFRKNIYKTKIGQDGLYSIWGENRYFYMNTNSRMEIKLGGYGFRITDEKGIEVKLGTSLDWKPLKMV